MGYLILSKFKHDDDIVSQILFLLRMLILNANCSNSCLLADRWIHVVLPIAYNVGKNKSISRDTIFGLYYFLFNQDDNLAIPVNIEKDPRKYKRTMTEEDFERLVIKVRDEMKYILKDDN